MLLLTIFAKKLHHRCLVGFQISLIALFTFRSLVLHIEFHPNLNFKHFILRWCCARHIFGSQIPVTTGGFKLRISCIRSSYLTYWAIRPNRFGGFGVPEFATLRQEQLILLRYFNLESSFKLRWCRAPDLFGSQIPVTIGGFELNKNQLLLS